MSDVLVDIDMPVEELETSVLNDVADNIQSLSDDESLRIPNPNKSSLRSTLCTILFPYLDEACRKALGATCRAWSQALDRIDPQKQSAACRVPIEIIQHVYSYLGPKDVSTQGYTTCLMFIRI